MTKVRNIAAFVLLAVYSIVFAHNVIPHHHHAEHSMHGSDLLCVHAAGQQHDHHHNGSHQHEHSHEDETTAHVQHAHSDDSQSHCHFEVKPVLSKIVDVSANYLISEVQPLPIPLEEEVTFAYIFYPQKLLQSYNLAVPLRAPPVFSYDQI
ncbi:MAG: hypothetical protein JEZ14_07645 [Marinilabiliaceae bacterium]|nr:hypothetical protein [Marinilabiliaceae bacterium]